MRQTNENSAAALLMNSRRRLISAFIAGNEPNFPQRHAELLDDYFRMRFETSTIGPGLNITKYPYAILAQGGYGRREQCLFSDVDVLILFENTIKGVENLIEEMVFPLWDMGLDVGHATRSVQESIKLAGRDITVLTALLDSRFICGRSNLYLDLMDGLHKKVRNEKSSRIIRGLVASDRKRHEVFGDSTYRLEPNLKEGQGGLRDYHTLLWIGRIRANVKTPRDLEYEGFLSHDEFRQLDRALSFLLEVRSRLHHLAGRKNDRLYFDYQIQMAESLAFCATDHQKPVERFLGRLHKDMEFIKELYHIVLSELGYQQANSRKKKKTKATKAADVVIHRGMITFVYPETVLSNPITMMEIFRESDRYGTPLSAEAIRLIKDFAPLLDESFFRSSRPIRLLEKLLVSGDPDHPALDQLCHADMMNRFIPEFREITNRIQFDAYHLFPVDKHSLHTVKVLQRWRRRKGRVNEPLCDKLYHEISRPDLLHWAALLHDIGKGSTVDDHSESGRMLALRILDRLGFSHDDAEIVASLINDHLFLIKIATRRDIGDEETCITCAGKVKDIEKLKMLYLLTVADSVSTGPNAWNDWTATLLRDLFLRVAKILETGELASEEAVHVRNEKKNRIREALLILGYPGDPEAVIRIMSPRYLLYTPIEDIMLHLKLRSALKANKPVWNIKTNHSSDTRTVTICAVDEPGLFSKIAGTFTINGIDILNAQAFTWRDNTALDIFEVKPPPDPIFESEKWHRAENHLISVLDGRMDLAPAIQEKTAAYGCGGPKIAVKPVRIEVDNASSSFFTIIEVFAYDYLGLLYDITDTLFHMGLDVWISKIATKADQVVDVFYVRDFDGQKVDSKDQEDRIKTALSKVIRTF
ncbi:MAG: [protein-PII] uridylyltransferase [Desulfobacterales bacterium]